MALLPVSAWGFEEHTLYWAGLPEGDGPCMLVETGEKIKKMGCFSVKINTRAGR